MKGIVLAGGSGTRLYPATFAISKQLLPIYDKPMIYYPIATLMSAGVREFLVISTPRDLPLFQNMLGDGEALGVSFAYMVQEVPRGIADALRIGADFIGADKVALILGDNVFFGEGIGQQIRLAAHSQEAAIFAYQVAEPSRYGVVEFDVDDSPASIVEKPATPRSNWAVTGLYVYDSSVVKIATELRPSARGELEITDVNQIYLLRKGLHVERFGRGVAWLDAGTHDSLLEAANFVSAVEKRQGRRVACLEEIALAWGWITPEDVFRIASSLGRNPYANYLEELARGASPEIELL